MKVLPRVVFFCSLLLAMPALAEIRSKLINIDRGGLVAPGCASPKVVDTKNIETPADGNWAERWAIDRCGTQVAYGVTCTNEKGGTSIALEQP